jgi:3-hydroxyisobutyrate dehydrogenase
MTDSDRTAGILTLAVVGLGDLGSAVADRLRATDHALRVFDVRAEQVKLYGAAAASSVSDAASGVDALIAVVGDDAQLEEVVDVAIAASPPPRLIIVHSTVHPETVRRLGARAAKAGVMFVDAPVTGGRPAVEHGVLTAFVAGEAPDVAAANDVLAFYCRNIDRVGSLGAGQITKIANNAMSIINTMLAVEVVRVLEGLGMDSEMARKAIVAGGTGSSRAFAGTDGEGFGTSWAKRRASLDPSLAQGKIPVVGIKDVGHALSLAQSAGVETPLIAAGLAQLRSF